MGRGEVDDGLGKGGWPGKYRNDCKSLQALVIESNRTIDVYILNVLPQ